MAISSDQAASKACELRAAYHLAGSAAVALLLGWDAEITLQPLAAQVEMSSVPPHLLQAWAAQVAPLAPDGWALHKHLSSYAEPPPPLPAIPAPLPEELVAREFKWRYAGRLAEELHANGLAWDPPPGTFGPPYRLNLLHDDDAIAWQRWLTYRSATLELLRDNWQGVERLVAGITQGLPVSTERLQQLLADTG